MRFLKVCLRFTKASGSSSIESGTVFLESGRLHALRKFAEYLVRFWSPSAQQLQGSVSPVVSALVPCWNHAGLGPSRADPAL